MLPSHLTLPNNQSICRQKPVDWKTAVNENTLFLGDMLKFKFSFYMKFYINLADKSMASECDNKFGNAAHDIVNVEEKNLEKKLLPCFGGCEKMVCISPRIVINWMTQ